MDAQDATDCQQIHYVRIYYANQGFHTEVGIKSIRGKISRYFFIQAMYHVNFNLLKILIIASFEIIFDNENKVQNKFLFINKVKLY